MTTPPNLTADFRGLIAATFTPMRDDGRVDVSAVPAYVDFLVGQGVSGLFVGGTTGEFASLTAAERMDVSEAFGAAADGRLPTIVHVGHNSLPDACLLADHAAEIGATAIAISPPTYFRPVHVDAAVEWCEQVSAVVPHLPLVYYHYPEMTGGEFALFEFLERATAELPALIGAKFSSGDLADFSLCLEAYQDRLVLMFGRDEMMLSALAVGTEVMVGTSYNHLARHYTRLGEAFRSGDLAAARSAQAQAARAIALLHSHGFLPAAKTCMKFLGVDCGPTRLPLKPLHAAQVETLRRELAQLNFASLAG